MIEKNQKEAATNNETRKHIVNVAKYIGIVTTQLQKRATDHDATKLAPPELELFTKFTSKLADCTYGSKEYKEFLKELQPALDHHYAKNRHHPEHYPNGINDMTLIDLVEMFCDWKAATLRHHDGNILKSIEENTNRFEMSEQLAQVLKNTAELFEHTDD